MAACVTLALNNRLETVDQEVGGSNPPSCTNKINKLGKRGRVCSKSFFGISCFALESLWNSSKDFRTRCCKINELTLTRIQAVRGSKPQPEPGTRTLPQRSRWAYKKRDEVFLLTPAHRSEPTAPNLRGTSRTQTQIRSLPRRWLRQRCRNSEASLAATNNSRRMISGNGAD